MCDDSSTAVNADAFSFHILDATDQPNVRKNIGYTDQKINVVTAVVEKLSLQITGLAVTAT